MPKRLRIVKNPVSPRRRRQDDDSFDDSKRLAARRDAVRDLLDQINEAQDEGSEDE